MTRRHLIPVAAINFDTRVRTLIDDIRPEWDESVKATHHQNYANLIAALCVELGAVDFQRKLQDFKAIGALPFSIISYHNDFLNQSRNAFVQGFYYPALTAASALGERILNHLVLDLREHYKHKTTYSKVANRSSFDNWQRAINVLTDWNVLLPEAATAFRKLEPIRLRSLHFSKSTYVQLREDALQAIQLLGNVVETQFSAIGRQPWFIEGTAGACFIKSDWEQNPFVSTYYLPSCPLVGVNYAYSNENGKWRLFDYRKHGDEIISDEEFCRRFNERDASLLAPTMMPPEDHIVCVEWQRRTSPQ